MRKRWVTKRRVVRSALFLVILWGALAMSLRLRSNPAGTHLEGPWRSAGDQSVSFLADLTWTNENGQIVRDQQIFDAVFELIGEAETFLVLDFFLINDFAGDPKSAPRALSGQLIDALAEAKGRRKALPILLITDPINRVYGSERHPGFERLEKLGVDVVETDLDALRDSNPTYSAVYRTLFRWFGNQEGGGFLPNPFLSDDETTLRSWLRLLNFKANHRKVAIAGRLEAAPVAIVTSANPHDASSGHSNVALRFEGDAALDLVASELTVADFSGWDRRAEFEPLIEQARGLTAISPGLAGKTDGQGLAGATAPTSKLELRVLSEGAIRDAALEAIDSAGNRDSVDLAMFYLGHRAIVESLLRAAQRGAHVRLVLDPNRDAFGRTKNGIPNRSVAHELISKSARSAELSAQPPIAVRWYKTHGEQFHTKLLLVRYAESSARNHGRSRLLLGSANFTRRNLDDFNLETNVEVRIPRESALEAEVRGYLERLWNNQQGEHFTLDYQRFEDASRWSALKYRWMERTGLSTF